MAKIYICSETLYLLLYLFFQFYLESFKFLTTHCMLLWVEMLDEVNVLGELGFSFLASEGQN